MKALLVIALAALVVPSCTEDAGRRPAGPTTDSPTQPWDPPKPAMGPLGALPEQPRR